MAGNLRLVMNMQSMVVGPTMTSVNNVGRGDSGNTKELKDVYRGYILFVDHDNVFLLTNIFCHTKHSKTQNILEKLYFIPYNLRV